MSSDKINPIGLLYEDFEKIVNNMTIKYFVKVEEFETLETQQAADEYLDVINGKDNFFTYIDYTRSDYKAVGWTDTTTIEEVISTGNTELVPLNYRDELFTRRRNRVLRDFEEKNNYYRMLNGYPNVEDTDYFYPSETLIVKYDIPNIPIHLIQDYGNNIQNGKGDLWISILEGTNYISNLYEKNPTKEYLKYIGSRRISIKTAREAKNFQCIQLIQSDIPQTVYDQFVLKYEQCREYFVKTVYMKEYRSFIDYYDNFIAMCIVVMTTQQMDVGQLMSGVKRQFFSIYDVRALYRAYNVPYNLDIDEATQTLLVQNLNLLIHNKSTNMVIYNIAYLLGFTNINIYKYYLGKERKFDLYGVPIVAFKEQFNTDIGEMETIPDYESMYDIYFQKEELRNHDLINTFNEVSNTVNYKEVVKDDPFWIEDDKLLKRLWETEYNFVESKYLGIGVAYSMTSVIFESTLLFKMILADKDATDTIAITLPRITGNLSISLFDLIIYMICLTASKHNLTGEIITIPTQVISVLDYMKNVEETDMLVDTLGFNFDYFDPSNEEARKSFMDVRAELGKDNYDQLMKYVDDIAYGKNSYGSERAKKINDMFYDAKGIYRFLRYHMTATQNRKTYTILKNMMNAIFFSRELRSVFTLKGIYSGVERTAWTYYEFLYNINPSLYNSFFTVDLEGLYNHYLVDHSLTPDEFTYEEYLIQIELGEIKVDYGTVNPDVSDTKDTTLYMYINHCIDRLSKIVEKLDLIYLINGTSTPLAELLVKLIKFFKSYTVDLISFETIFILDFKPGNTFKLTDEFKSIIKKIAKNDNLYLSHGDVIHGISVKEDVFDKLSLEEKLLFTSLITLKDTSLTLLRDYVDYFTKVEEITTDDLRKLYDATRINSTMNVQDKTLKFKDTIKKLE